MAEYIVIVPKKVHKATLSIPLPWQERIRKVLRTLATSPLLGEPLHGKFKGQRKIRVWPYRIIYFISNEKRHIVITEVGHRGNVSYR